MSNQPKHDFVGDRTTGFASPAADYIETTIDLAGLLELRRPSRHPVRVRGAAYPARAIRDGDTLIADTSLRPKAGDLVIANVAGTPVLAALEAKHGRWFLVMAAPEEPPIMVGPDSDVDIWAAVTGVVRDCP